LSFDHALEQRYQPADVPKGKRSLGRQRASSEYASPLAKQLSGPLSPSGDGWATADKSAGIIEATDTTRWFGFKDDVAVRMTRWGSGTRVDVRSVSRIGASDVGTNARRIRRFLGALQAF
jgi:hypothetical protein